MSEMAKIPTKGDVKRGWVGHRAGQLHRKDEPIDIEALTKAFERWLEQVKADAWDEGYRDGHNDGLSDGHPLGNDREPEENPYRKQEEA